MNNINNTNIDEQKVEDILEDIERNDEVKKEEEELEKKLSSKVKRFCASLKNKETEQKLKIIQTLAKGKTGKSIYDINNEIFEKGIALLYVSKEIEDILGKELYQQLLNKKPLDIDL